MEFRAPFPILEFDNGSQPIISPRKIDLKDYRTQYGILCFSHEIIEKYRKNHKFQVIKEFETVVLGKWPAFSYTQGEKRFIVMNSGLGAPFAAFSLELLIAMGCKKIMVFGMAGVLKSSLEVGHITIPSTAVRDEGTSYHYLPPSRTVSMKKSVLSNLIAILEKKNVPFEVGSTWTTDSFYRETKDKIQLRKSEGCLTVEMEAAALFAVAEHRNVDLGYLLGSGDDVSGDNWDSRKFFERKSIHEKLFELSVELVQQI